MTGDLVWADPPDVGAGLVRYANIAAALIERPDEWALWPNGLSTRNAAYALQRAISYGRLQAFAPAGSFQATMRTEGESWKLYIRYVGHRRGQSMPAASDDAGGS